MPKNFNNKGRKNPSKLNKHVDGALPYVIKNLPEDPPTINTTPPREEKFPIQIGALSEGVTAALAYSVIETAIGNQAGYGSSTFYYQILKVCTWGGVTGVQSLTMKHTATGITAFDTGSAAFRTKAGIAFPPAYCASTVHAKGASGNFVAVTSDVDDAEPELHLTVRHWS